MRHHDCTVNCRWCADGVARPKQRYRPSSAVATVDPVTAAGPGPVVGRALLRARRRRRTVGLGVWGGRQPRGAQERPDAQAALELRPHRSKSAPYGRSYFNNTFNPGSTSDSLMYPIAPGVELTKLMTSIVRGNSRGGLPCPMLLRTRQQIQGVRDRLWMQSNTSPTSLRLGRVAHQKP